MSHNTFAALGVPAGLCDVLARDGITTPTPIQAATLPDSLAGRDVLGRGRTGSGKTYAFLLPIVARLTSSGADRAGRRMPRIPRAPRALILAPTRELAGQIETALKPLAASAGLTTLAVFGGVGQSPQVRALRAGVDVLVACPGRLEDLIAQGECRLGAVEVTVLDEADHMADLGFLPAVRRLLTATPARSQRLLFSATLDAAIDVLVKRFLTNPVTHQADSAQSPIATMEHHLLQIDAEQRLPVLVDLASASKRILVFTRTKHRAKLLARQLNAHGVPSVELHGNLAQNARTRNLAAFHSGEATTLVATDIAARGIHVDDIALVVHADPPTEHKAYLHRSGRTARAGASGKVVTLMQREQVRDVRALTKAAGISATTTAVAVGHPLLEELAPGERRFVTMLPIAEPPRSTPGRIASPRSGAPRSRGARSGAPRSDSPRSDSPRATAPRGDGSRSTAPSGSGGRSRQGYAGAAPAGTWSASRVSEQRGGRRRRAS